MLLQLSNIRFEIKIYFQLGMDFIHASLCGLSLPPPQGKKSKQTML